MKRVLYKDLSANVLQLPRLPIPPVAETLARYRDSVLPLKRKDVAAKHLRRLAAFEDSGAAARLQEQLVALDAAAAAGGAYPYSYVERLWDDGYLCFRGPSPVNIAPALKLKPFSKPRTQAQTAAALVAAIARWIARALAEGVEARGDPTTDVSQLDKQFCFARLPHAERDQFHAVPLSQARFVTVLRGGHPFLVRVFGDDGRPVSETELVRAFEHVLSVTPSADNPAPVSVLTSGPRADWAASLAELLKVPGNDAALAAIRDSVIVVCLDEAAWGGDAALVQRAMLHGGEAEFENRWYDKHQLIVSADGQVAGNFEHAFSDGLSWSRWLGDVVADIEGGAHAPAGSEAVLGADAAASLVQPLSITFGKTLAPTLRDARQAMQRLCDGVALERAVLPVGRARLKKLRFSPDAFTQLTLHAAYWALNGKLAPTYESCSTAHFFHGRTETIRTASADVHAAVAAPADAPDLAALMRAAAATHQRLAKEAAAGMGVDRHLLALKDVARQAGDTTAQEFFNDDVYGYCGTWLLSTSNVSQPFLELFNFGPVTEHGYGVGYIIDNDSITASVSSFASSGKTNAADFATAVQAASARLIAALEADAASKSS